MKILVTGGAGFIGSHTCVELLKDKGTEIVIIDNLRNSKKEAINRIEKISSRKVKFYQNDLLDKTSLESIFSTENIDAVIHFAALKAVGESVSMPLEYYENNLNSTINLLNCMKKFNVKKIVFSSSATVYGNPESNPISETAKLNCTNPYGRTKLFNEEILKDFATANNAFGIVLLRYFNPIGAHASGLIGEDPQGIPNNLVPYISQVASGKLETLKVFGNDYNTKDGTGVRDYIHVVDLAHGHVLALKKLESSKGVLTYNLGTGRGYSVLEVLKAFENTLGKPIPHVFFERRPGDIAVCYANPEKAEKELGFKAAYDLNVMVKDAWNWQKNNPEGYKN
ncbi:MAG: UDP-glucose 4-epimerase GalE [Erysipelotrichales bacterium]|nr:UDP-glucose 4-epimerase GalE [Erysipelotrichales bacterium]